MLFVVVHEVPGRLRARVPGGFSRHFVPTLREALEALPGVTILALNARTGGVLCRYADTAARAALLQTLGRPKEARRTAALPVGRPSADATAAPASRAVGARFDSAGRKGGGRSRRAVLRHGAHRLPPPFVPLVRYFILRPLLPGLVRAVTALWRAAPFILRGGRALARGRVNVDVLDASALAVSLLRRDFRTVGLLAVLLGVGEALESWTRRTSLASLSESLSLNVDKVWVRAADGAERFIPLAEVTGGDLVVVRAGAAVPVDGVVESGEALVNQAAMTGEPLGVRRTAGGSVFAGSVVEEGELVVRATGVGEQTRLTRILRFIEESEALKAGVQTRAERLADAVVPFSFLLAGAVWLITRNPARAASVLLVDYSCALRLATPLAVLSAMRQAAGEGLLIKGGRYLEGLARADLAVFDKTGTLTGARPSVTDVVPVLRSRAEILSREDVLRITACLEEHFPHPVARAVVRRAEDEGLTHAEEHAEVEYVVAHGIASRLHGKRVLVGSRHYVGYDEGVDLAPAEDLIRELSGQGRSLLYLALDGELAGIVALEDPVRPEAAAVLTALANRGLSTAMLTGDDERTAAAVAARLGIDEYRSHVLPADKVAAVRQWQEQGHAVLMVGDGINDSPALSAADAGVAMRDGADLAREVAGVVLTADGRGLTGLLTAVDLGRGVMRRIRSHFAVILGFNSLFLLLGLTGLLRPGLAAALHNGTTVAVAVNAMRPLRLPGAAALHASDIGARRAGERS